MPGGDVITLKTAVTIDAKEGEIHIDFAGSSGQSPYGINVVMNYTHAYSTFAIRSCLDPELPNNFGSLAPIKVTAPEGCIVNCKYPAPVNARHVVGMYRADADPQGALSRHARSRAGRRLGRGVDDPDPGQECRRLAVYEFDVQLFGRHGRAAHQERTVGHMLSDRRRGGAGRGAGSFDADRVQQEGTAPRLGRRRRIARRRRSDRSAGACAPTAPGY